MKIESSQIVIITVVYGKRWHLLKQVIDASLKEIRVIKFIVSDNGSSTPEIKDEYLKKYGSRLEVIENNHNIGYSSAIKKAIERAREINCDYVLNIDDDSVPEDNYLDHYFSALKFFPNSEKIILTCNKETVSGYKEIFYNPVPTSIKVDGTVFEPLRVKNILNFFRNYIFSTQKRTYPFVPIRPSSAFVTGGSLIPIQAVKDAPLPDETMIMYGEDLKYAWSIRALGYESYLVYRPKFYDIDLTFSTSEPNSHIWGLFSSRVPDYKVYLRLRNSIRISREFSYQNKIWLFINIVFWFQCLILLGAVKTQLRNPFFHRVKIILQALRDGYNKKDLPENIKLPR